MSRDTNAAAGGIGVRPDPLRDYPARGWSIIPIDHRSKNPNRRDWQNATFTAADFPPEPFNVGIHLGERSGRLTDVDLDHSYAVELADDFLPHTPAVFGRRGKPRSHRLYITTAPIDSKPYKSRDAGTIVEIRASGQTVFPPSVHPSGEPIEWEQWPADPAEIDPAALREAVEQLNRAALCWLEMDKIGITDGKDGSRRLFACCCRCVEHDLTDAGALAVIRAYAVDNPFPRTWTDEEIIQRLRDAERKTTRGEATGETRTRGPKPAFVPAHQLIAECPRVRPFVIDGILRESETAAIVAPTKRGKSWLVDDAALSIATGNKLFGRFDVAQGNVLIIDNELHREVIADRIKRVAAARFVEPAEFGDRLFVESLRGRLADIHAMSDYFAEIESGRFRLVILDAGYRFIPSGTSENDNAGMAQFFNRIDQFAAWTNAAFLLVHHSSKGDQSGKAVTDVGSGAGSQSRAVDAHLVMRQHVDPDCVVLDGAVRSFPPLSPVVLRWRFPVWNVDEGMDAEQLKRPENPRQQTTDRETYAAIRATLFGNPEGACQRAIRKGTGFGAERVSRGINHGLRDGWIEDAGTVTAANGKDTTLYRLKTGSDGRTDGMTNTLP